MSLHPQVKAMLEEMESLGLPPAETLTPEVLRETRMQVRPGEPVAWVEDRRIPRRPLDIKSLNLPQIEENNPSGDVLVRIYRPQTEGVLPALVWYHGGGWVLGSLETADQVCRALANAAGCAVVSVDYRLAPEHPFPAGLEDAYSALLWVLADGNGVGIDRSRVAVGGDSAGGNLAAAAALLAREGVGMGEAETHRPCFQFLIYPVTQHGFDTPSYSENATGYFLTQAMMRFFWNHYLRRPEDGQNPLASPLLANDLKGLPPAWVATAQYDPLRDEGEAYANRLKEAGVTVESVRYDGMIHGFFANPDLEVGRQALADGAQRLKKALA